MPADRRNRHRLWKCALAVAELRWRFLVVENARAQGAYLYQLYAYLRSQERADDPATLTSEGMLLHPQTGGAVDEVMTIQGHALRFKSNHPA